MILIVLGCVIPALALILVAWQAAQRDFDQMSVARAKTQTASAPVRAGKRNIILISLDTTRRDHLGLYGYERDTTPFLDSLANEMTIYERATSTSSWTLPSHASMFTGLLPSEHNAGHGRNLSPEVRTLAEHFQSHGYNTLGIVASPYLRSEFGLNQGFRTYDDGVPGGYPRDIDILSKLAPSLIAHPGKRRADQVADLLINLRGESLVEPYFLFLHFFDAHSRYTAPFTYAWRYRRWSGGTPYYAADQTSIVNSVNVDNLPLDDDLREIITGQYDANIRYIDDHLRRIWTWLGARGKLANTTVILTADHGESFGERNMLGHGRSLHGEQINVPLLVWRGSGEAGPRNETPVDSRAVFRLALAEARLPFPDLIAENSRTTAEYLPNPFKPESKLPRFSFPKKAAMHQCLKSLDDEDGTVHLYNVCEDPYETRNLIASSAPEAFSSIAMDLISDVEDKRSLNALLDIDRELKVSPEVKDQLRALGYLQ